VLLILSIRPSFLQSLPSIKDHYASDGADLSETWQARLLDLAPSASHAEQCEALKWALRRLTIVSHRNVIPLVDGGAYVAFVRAEREAGYTADAYGKLFLARVPHAVGQTLHELFDVWAALVARSGAGSTLGGKVCLLLGRWIMGRNERTKEWQEIYGEWYLAGQRVQHLFLAWIRCVRGASLASITAHTQTSIDRPGTAAAITSSPARRRLSLRAV
jgi:hypothetical protein